MTTAATSTHSLEPSLALTGMRRAAHPATAKEDHAGEFDPISFRFDEDPHPLPQ